MSEQDSLMYPMSCQRNPTVHLPNKHQQPAALQVCKNRCFLRLFGSQNDIHIHVAEGTRTCEDKRDGQAAICSLHDDVKCHSHPGAAGLHSQCFRRTTHDAARPKLATATTTSSSRLGCRVNINIARCRCWRRLGDCCRVDESRLDLSRQVEEGFFYIRVGLG